MSTPNKTTESKTPKVMTSKLTKNQLAVLDGLNTDHDGIVTVLDAYFDQIGEMIAHTEPSLRLGKAIQSIGNKVGRLFELTEKHYVDFCTKDQREAAKIEKSTKRLETKKERLAKLLEKAAKLESELAVCQKAMA